jgi:hypothetical protein
VPGTKSCRSFCKVEAGLSYKQANVVKELLTQLALGSFTYLNKGFACADDDSTMWNELVFRVE